MVVCVTQRLCLRSGVEAGEVFWNHRKCLAECPAVPSATLLRQLNCRGRSFVIPLSESERHPQRAYVKPKRKGEREVIRVKPKHQSAHETKGKFTS